jgi:coenzyme F420-reducing hydrogenase alpha subunit
MKNNYLAKIEGHGKLDIDLKKGQVHLIIAEGERLFEALVLGQKYSQVPFIVSRICGICPTAHNIASILALEKALEIEVNQEITDLRKIMLQAQIIQSHILHLFFFALPDYVKKDSGFDIAKKYPSEFNLVLRIKKTCDEILEIIGGRSVHPISTCVGGFRQKIKKEDLNKIITLINEIIDETENFVKFFDKLKYPTLRRETEYLALSNSEYPLLAENVQSSFDKVFSVKNFKKEIKEQIKPYSSAKFGFRERKDPKALVRGEKGFMVGALPRISLAQNKLNAKAYNLAQKLGVHFPTYNSFHNNFAQSIEV